MPFYLLESSSFYIGLYGGIKLQVCRNAEDYTDVSCHNFNPFHHTILKHFLQQYFSKALMLKPIKYSHKKGGQLFARINSL